MQVLCWLVEPVAVVIQSLSSAALTDLLQEIQGREGNLASVLQNKVLLLLLVLLLFILILLELLVPLNNTISTCILVSLPCVCVCVMRVCSWV